VNVWIKTDYVMPGSSGGFSEHGNEALGSKKGRQFLEQLLFLMEIFAASS
jgi:hypothetical protein